jgi:predicted ATPase
VCHRTGGAGGGLGGVGAMYGGLWARDGVLAGARSPGAPVSGAGGADLLAQLQQWAPIWLAQLSGVLPTAEQARLQRRTLGATRARLFRELAEALEALTQAQLGVLVLEDLHWSDPSTVEILTMLARRREAAVATYVAHHFPAPVVQPIAAVLYQRTAGHPLFMMHLVAYLAQQARGGAEAEAALAARVAAGAEAIPSGVQQLIELQLEQLHVDEQRVLEMASGGGGVCRGQ